MADEGTEFRTPSGGLSAIVNHALSEGLSQRAAMREARDLGLRFQDTAFRNLWHSQEATALARADTLAQPFDATPDEGMYQETEWGRPGTYYTWLRMQSRIEGTADIIEQFMVVDTDRPVSPDEAIEELQNRLAEAETPNDTGKGLVTLGIDVWGLSWVPPTR